MRVVKSWLLTASLPLALASAAVCVPGHARAVDAEPASGGGVAAHLAKLDFSDGWGETVDWAKLDLITRELAPDRLDWNGLCLASAGRPLADFPDGLPKAEADRFVAALAARLREIAVAKHVDLSENDRAIVACAVVPMQEVKGAGQKYVTSLGDTSRLGTAIVKLVRTGVNCGDGCVLTYSLLRALQIDCRFVGCHRKVSLPSQPAGHAMVEYFEANTRGKRFGHIVDATNMTPINVGGELMFRPPASRFQIVGDQLARLQFLIANSFIHEAPALQGFSPPFSKEELASPEAADFAWSRWDARLDGRAVVLDSTQAEATVPVGKSLVYKIISGKDIPEGAVPIARMYRKGADGVFRSLAPFTLHRRSDSKELRLVWDSLIDGLAPGDYRADFYIDDGAPGYGFRRGGQYAGEQIIHYGAAAPAPR
jgi:hypothetical protein